MVISLIGTIVMITLFIFELNAYRKVDVSTTLVVDELVDEMLRMNFNVTLHQVRWQPSTQPHTSHERHLEYPWYACVRSCRGGSSACGRPCRSLAACSAERTTTAHNGPAPARCRVTT